MVKKIFLGLVLLFVVMQFVRIDRTNPPVDPTVDLASMHNMPQNVKAIMKKACYDCHSFETVYPWYTNIAPVSWWIGDHIEHGRDELNFSVWGTYSEKRQDHKIDEINELVEEGEMPLESYLIVHGDAKLTDQEVKEMLDWVNNLD